MIHLTDEGVRILQLASSSKDDSVLLLDFLDGATLQVAGQNLLDGQDARTIARYRSAVKQLHSEGLIEDRAGKGEVFFLTGAGYDMAEHSTAH